ncbi:MAG: DUF3800 domain-containing protein [Rhabdochlamydiaceae bacterium]
MENLKNYLLFADDSGTKEYSSTSQYLTQGGGLTPYFVFGGLIVTPAIAGYLTKKMHEFKLAFFGKNVEIKANWLRVEKERKKRYLDPFAKSEADMKHFSEQIYDLIITSECILVACAINKQEVQLKYPKPHYAPSIAYDCLLQRAQQEMKAQNGRLQIIMDDMSGATPKKNQYKENLEIQHKNLLTRGSPLRRGMIFDRIGQLTFSDSQADERLQLADLVAYAVYRQFMEYGDRWETEGDELPTYSYFDKIAHKFRKDGNGRIQGYGVVKFPLKNRVGWTIKEKPMTVN